MNHGYILLKCPEHPDASKNNGYVYEHRLIAENAIGRRLTGSERVHHINCQKADNRNANLLICTLHYHKDLHIKMRRAGWKED